MKQAGKFFLSQKKIFPSVTCMLLFKLSVAKSNPLSGGRGSLSAASPVKKNV